MNDRYDWDRNREREPRQSRSSSDYSGEQQRGWRDDDEDYGSSSSSYRTGDRETAARGSDYGSRLSSYPGGSSSGRAASERYSGERYSGERYAGSGYGPTSPGAGGDYFGTGDYGSGAHAWDQGSNASRGQYATGARWSGGYAGGSGTYGESRQYSQRETRGGGQMGGGYARDSYGEGGEERGFLARAGDEVMSWFGDEDAARRREMDHSGKGPSDYTRSDERIREDANDRLTDDWRVDARKITVSVDGGEVTLSGTVSTRQEKHRAEECVERVSGVKHVQNNLRVEAGAQTQQGAAGHRSELEPSSGTNRTGIAGSGSGAGGKTAGKD